MHPFKSYGGKQRHNDDTLPLQLSDSGPLLTWAEATVECLDGEDTLYSIAVLL